MVKPWRWSLLLVCLGCAPEYAFDNVCDPRNNRLDECPEEASSDAGPVVPPVGGCQDEELPCNGVDDDCDQRVDEIEEPGYVCQRPGSFSLALDGDRRVDVEITRYLLVARTEVTRRAWRSHIERNPEEGDLAAMPCSDDTRCCEDECPQVDVAWRDAVRYCNGLTDAHNEVQPENRLERCYIIQELPGGGETITFAGVGCSGYRLPTEAEWLHIAMSRYAPRVDGVSVDEVGHFGQAPCRMRAVDRAVGSLVEVDGVRDLLGNGAEWVFDTFGAIVGDVAGAGPFVDPVGGTRANEGVEPWRVIRGASACHRPTSASAALEWREGQPVYASSPATGFRVVRSTGRGLKR